MIDFPNRYFPGQVVQHRLFGYRGVIVGVDPVFRLSAEWYEQMARTRPPKDQPWYHVLVSGSEDTTYVAERNLELDPARHPVDHPLLERYFDTFDDGVYLNSQEVN